LAAALAAALAGTAAAQLQLPGTALTSDPAQDVRPAFSPDGQSIVFQSSRSGSYNILLMDAQGGGQRFLTEGAYDNRRPAWSADGQWVAFDSDRAGTRDIWVVNVSTGALTQITNGEGQETFPSFSLDGRQLAFYAYSGGHLDLWRVELEDVLAGGALPAPQRVTNGLADERANQCTFACHSAAWSPDGQHLLYTGGNHTQIWMVGVDGSEPHPVAGGGEKEHFPSWTADGRILFLSERITQDRDPVNDIWVMDADGGNLNLLFEAVPHGGPLEFQVGSNTVAFHSPRTGNFDIYTTVLGQDPVAVVEPAVTAPPDLNLGAPTQAPAAEAAPPTAAAPATSQALLPPTAAAETGPAQGTAPAATLRWVGLGLLGLFVLAGGGLLLSQVRRAPPT
jgi:Tol biopolymer transport system component